MSMACPGCCENVEFVLFGGEGNVIFEGIAERLRLNIFNVQSMSSKE